MPSTTAAKIAIGAGPRIVYGVRNEAGGWWSEVLGRFLHPRELAEPRDLPLLIVTFDFMTAGILYGVHYDLDAYDGTWQAMPLPPIPGFNAPEVRQ